ncbi:lytic polysaccharide monooxygenase [Colwelliaceae bacterium MEBiC 14330]
MPKIQFKVTTTALTLALASTLLGVNQQASAHGYMYSPMARQAFCELQQGYWWPEDGSNIPNAACRAAYLESGHFQFVQAPEFSKNTSNYNDLESVKANIPNGTLCAGGDVNKRGIDLPSPYWQRTEVRPNANGDIKIKFFAATPHNPGYWQFFLSNAGYDGSTMPLTWQDISLVQSHGNIDFIKAADGNRYYEMDVNLPADRVGDAILYTRWQRNDAAGEGFYNCSDITIVRDNSPVESWFNAGFYLKQGQNASIGERVNFRAFNATGQEIINQQLAITETNQATWASDLAQSLNLNYANIINIGIKDVEGNIVFDSNNLLSNVTYLSDREYTFALSIQDAPVNTAPIVRDIDSVVMEESSSQAIHVHAFDDQQSTLNYTWQIPTAISYSGSDANITITAPTVEEDTDFTLSIAVSDGELTTSKSFTVTVINAVIDPTIPPWDSNIAYSSGDKVSYQSKIYSAKWWNKNQTPNSSSAWQLESSTDDGTAIWNPQNEYSQGSVVSYQGVIYQAKWWTQGEQPDVSNVWQQQ